MYFNKSILLHNLQAAINNNPVVHKNPLLISHHKSFLLEKIMFLESILENHGSIVINKNSHSIFVSLDKQSSSSEINETNFSSREHELSEFLIKNHFKYPLIEFSSHYLKEQSIFTNFYKTSFDFILSKLTDYSGLFNKNSYSILEFSKKYNYNLMTFFDAIKVLSYKPDYSIDDPKKTSAFLEKFILLPEFRPYIEPHKHLVSNFIFVTNNLSLTKDDYSELFLKSISVDNMNCILDGIDKIEDPDFKQNVLSKIQNIYIHQFLPLTNYSKLSDTNKDDLSNYFLNNCSQLKDIEELHSTSELNSYDLPLDLVSKGAASYKPQTLFKKKYQQKFENVVITFGQENISFNFLSELPLKHKEAIIYSTYNNTLDIFKNADVVSEKDIDILLVNNNSTILEINLNNILSHLDINNKKTIKAKI